MGFFGVGVGFKNCFLFLVPSILTFDFDLILGSLITFLGPNGIFVG